MPPTLTITVHPLTAVGGRTANTFGIGEAVELRCAVAPGPAPVLTWDFATGSTLANLSQTATGDRCRLVIYGQEGTIKVRVKTPAPHSVQKISPALKVVIPSEWKLHHQAPQVLGHRQDQASAGFEAMMLLKNPHSVSFANLIVYEGIASGVGTGILAHKNNERHAKGPELRPLAPQPAGVPAGYLCFGFDKVRNEAQDGPFPLTAHMRSSFTWNIPWHTQLRTAGLSRDIDGDAVVVPENRRQPIRMAQLLRHHEMIEASGRTTMSKGGVTVSFDLAAVDVGLDTVYA